VPPVDSMLLVGSGDSNDRGLCTLTVMVGTRHDRLAWRVCLRSKHVRDGCRASWGKDVSAAQVTCELRPWREQVQSDIITA